MLPYLAFTEPEGKSQETVFPSEPWRRPQHCFRSLKQKQAEARSVSTATMGCQVLDCEGPGASGQVLISVCVGLRALGKHSKRRVGSGVSRWFKHPYTLRKRLAYY